MGLDGTVEFFRVLGFAGILSGWLASSVDLYFQGKKLLIRELKKTPKKEAA